MVRLPRVILGFAVIVALSACAGPASSGPGNPTDSSGSSPTESSQTSACGSHVVVNESANGSQVCVVLGSDLIVMLPVNAGTTWSQPDVVGAGLGPGQGIPTPNNAVGWSFKAVAAGTAEVRSSRANCAEASPGMAACHSLAAFRVRVDIR